VRTLVDRSYFYLTEEGVEEELGELFQLVLLEEPQPEDFLDACKVLEYYSRNVLKVLTDVKESSTTVCSPERALKLVARTQDGGYVAVCSYHVNDYSEWYVCELYYYTEDEF